MVVRYWIEQSPATVVKDVYRVNFRKDNETVIFYRVGEGNAEVTVIKGKHYDFLTVTEE